VGIFNGVNISSSLVPFQDSDEKALALLLSSMDKRFECGQRASDGHEREDLEDSEYSFEQRSGKLKEGYLTERDLRSQFSYEADSDLSGTRAIEWGSVFGITQNKSKVQPDCIRCIT
jgi:hypothetical protein